MGRAGAGLRALFGAREGEERAVLLAFGYFFLLLCSYYLLRPVRDAMGASAGVGRMPWLFTTTFLVMLALTPCSAPSCHGFESAGCCRSSTASSR